MRRALDGSPGQRSPPPAYRGPAAATPETARPLRPGSAENGTCLPATPKENAPPVRRPFVRSPPLGRPPGDCLVIFTSPETERVSPLGLSEPARRRGRANRFFFTLFQNLDRCSDLASTISRPPAKACVASLCRESPAGRHQPDSTVSPTKVIGPVAFGRSGFKLQGPTDPPLDRLTPGTGTRLAVAYLSRRLPRRVSSPLRRSGRDRSLGQPRRVGDLSLVTSTVGGLRTVARGLSLG